MRQKRDHARVLIVAHQAADSLELLAAVASRAAEGPCYFTLLVPSSPHGLHRVADPADRGMKSAERRLDAALPKRELAAMQVIHQTRSRLAVALAGVAALTVAACGTGAV